MGNSPQAHSLSLRIAHSVHFAHHLEPTNSNASFVSKNCPKEGNHQSYYLHFAYLELRLRWKTQSREEESEAQNDLDGTQL